jgi:hypothetical protein
MVPNPSELAGAAERVDQIVSTSISEPPVIEVRSIRKGDDSGVVRPLLVNMKEA